MTIGYPADRRAIAQPTLTAVFAAPLRTRRDIFEAMTKRNWWAMFLSFFGMALLCAPFAVVSGYNWLALDEPNRRYECKGGSTCWSGESVNMMLASMFGALTVIFAGITVVILIRWRRWRIAQAALPTKISVEM